MPTANQSSLTPRKRKPPLRGTPLEPQRNVEPSPSLTGEASPSSPTGPAYWKFLGTTPGKPFIPFQSQLDDINRIQIPAAPGGPRVYTNRCGRRYSKTTIGEKILWKGILAPDDFFGPPTVRLTADTEEHAQKIWRLFTYHVDNSELRALVKDWSKEFNRIEFINGATLQLFSANNPRTLSGDGVSLWVVDEAQFFSQEAYDNMFPSATERNGVIVMLGTAEGDGPFRAASFMGESSDYPEFVDTRHPTLDNPFIPRAAVELAQRVLPPYKFRQLYLAEWVSEIGTIFTGVENCIDARPMHEHPYGHLFTDPPALGHTYYGGLDLARMSDWSVYFISDRNGRIVAADRFSRLDWDLQKARIARLSAFYGHPLTAADATGVGDPIVADLINLGMNVLEVKLSSNQQKNSLIDDLAVRISSKKLRYPNYTPLVNELKRFEAKKSKSGQYIIYEAPAGANDDCVLALALLNKVLPRTIAAEDYYTSEMVEYQRALNDDTAALRQVGSWESI